VGAHDKMKLQKLSAFAKFKIRKEKKHMKQRKLIRRLSLGLSVSYDCDDVMYSQEDVNYLLTPNDKNHLAEIYAFASRPWVQ
jgi:hypothetical protein